MSPITTSPSTARRPRKSVAISEQDLRDLAVIREAPEASGLAAEETSEAAVLALALHEGIQVLREAREGALYSAEAAGLTGDADAAAEREQLRARRARNATRREGAYS